MAIRGAISETREFCLLLCPNSPSEQAWGKLFIFLTKTSILLEKGNTDHISAVVKVLIMTRLEAPRQGVIR